MTVFSLPASELSGSFSKYTSTFSDHVLGVIMIELSVHVSYSCGHIQLCLFRERLNQKVCQYFGFKVRASVDWKCPPFLFLAILSCFYRGESYIKSSLCMLSLKFKIYRNKSILGREHDYQYHCFFSSLQFMKQLVSQAGSRSSSSRLHCF